MKKGDMLTPEQYGKTLKGKPGARRIVALCHNPGIEGAIRLGEPPAKGKTDRRPWLIPAGAKDPRKPAGRPILDN